MYDLISGEEAKVFWGNGGVIELKPKCANIWLSEPQNFPLSVFYSQLYDFRRKKETVSITLELPKPFQPKVGGGIGLLHQATTMGILTQFLVLGLSNHVIIRSLEHTVQRWK